MGFDAQRSACRTLLSVSSPADSIIHKGAILQISLPQLANGEGCDYRDALLPRGERFVRQLRCLPPTSQLQPLLQRFAVLRMGIARSPLLVLPVVLSAFQLQAARCNPDGARRALRRGDSASSRASRHSARFSLQLRSILELGSEPEVLPFLRHSHVEARRRSIVFPDSVCR